MGAVVGGLYAAGLSGDEIEAAFRALDWQELLRDRAPDRVGRRFRPIQDAAEIQSPDGRMNPFRS
jgi:NTE family protein